MILPVEPTGVEPIDAEPLDTNDSDDGSEVLDLTLNGLA